MAKSNTLFSDNGSFFKGWDFVIKILIYTKYVLIKKNIENSTV